MRILLLQQRSLLWELIVETLGSRVVGMTRQPAEVLRQLPLLQPNLVLGDFAFRDEAGYQAVSELAAAVPLVVLTNYQGPQQVVRCLNRGARGFLPDTCALQELESALTTVAEGGSYLHPQLALGAFELAQLEASQKSKATDLERQLLLYIAAGLSNQEMARLNATSLSTVKSQLRVLFQKLSAQDRTQALLSAFRRGILNDQDLRRTNIQGHSLPVT